MSKFYKTVYTFEVLSEGQMPDCISLRRLHDACDSGDCVGRFTETKETELTGKETADALYAFGSDPAFFMLNDAGEESEENQ